MRKYSKEELIEKLRVMIEDEKFLDNNKIRDLFKSENNVPSWNVYKKRFKVNNVVELCDKLNISISDKVRIRNKSNTKNIMTKEEVSEIVLNMQSKLNRPLMYDDFRHPSVDEIGITIIKNYWGSMNKMKEELGLKIIQEDMVSKHIDDVNIIINELHYICDKVKETGRKTITVFDIETLNRIDSKEMVFRRCCKQNKTSIRNVIENYGCSYQKEGNGLNHFYKDGEKVVSQYELNFSDKLREYKFSYNNTYFRDVRYKELDNNYNGFMNCDYEIHIKDRIFYVEIAGMLSGKCEINHKNNLKQSSKSKQTYSDKLKEKEQMFIDNNLEYYILFPSDLKDLDKLFSDVLKIEKKGNDE